MSLALYRKYRPSGFADVVGQEHVVKTLKNAIKNDKVSHAYLFSGPRGTGKTSIARILAKAVNCENLKNGEPCEECANCKGISTGQFLDLVEIDAATNTQVDKMRDIIERVNFSPSSGKKKVYIIDEVHMLSKGAFNALLKTLEEPPAHVLFILATTEIHKIPATIISRCQRFDFRHLRVEEIKKRLALIAEKEQVEVEDGVLEYVAITSGGGMRDSESLFGQIISLQDDKMITLKEVQDILSLPGAMLSVDIVKAILDKQYGDAVLQIGRIAEDGYDLAELNKSIVEYLRKLLLVKMSPSAKNNFTSQMTQEQLDELVKIAATAQLGRIFKIIGAFMKSQNAIKGAVLPQLPLELAIAEIEIAEEGNLTTGAKADYNGKVSAEPVKATPAKKEILQAPAAKPLDTQAEEEIKAEIREAEANVVEEKAAEPEAETAEVEETHKEKAETTNSSNEAVPFEQVKSDWTEIAMDMRKTNGSLVACLKTCQPIVVEGGEILVACQYSFYKTKLQKPENRMAVEQIASETVKAQVRLKFITKEEAQQRGFEMEEIHAEEKQAEDLVNSALDMFGGEVVA
ncbi:MAG: DNA polymerase III subunit gamma/tau [Candidatus Pacebacteria bacterium]|nr:DNA polymerase III subunit gamma/tau [Candidatus Paceibacterota bacterium]